MLACITFLTTSGNSSYLPPNSVFILPKVSPTPVDIAPILKASSGSLPSAIALIACSVPEVTTLDTTSPTTSPKTSPVLVPTFVPNSLAYSDALP